MKTLGILVIGIVIISACVGEDAKENVRIGYNYYKGEGVTQDYAEALKWFRKSADQGDADAQLALGYMYFNGQGVSKNLAEAKNWYGKAAAQGDEDALKMMKKLTEMNF